MLVNVPDEEIPFCFEKDKESCKGNDAFCKEERTALVWRQGKRKSLYQKPIEFGMLFSGCGIDARR